MIGATRHNLVNVSMQQVYDFYDNGRYQEVIQLIERNDFVAKTDPQLANVVAASYFKIGQFAESLSLLREVESCFSDDPAYLSLYGACLRRFGDLEAARSRFEQALKIQPDNAAIRNNFANLLIDLGCHHQAESILGELLSKNPGYTDARVNMQRLKEARRIQQLQSFASSSETSKWTLADPLLLAFGEDEVQRTRPKPSQSDLPKNGLEGKLPPLKQQQVASDQLSLALQAVREGRYDFALQLCSQAYQTMPASAALLECVSDAYIALQRFTEAETCLLHALQLGGKSFKLYANLISLLCIRADFVLAQHYLELVSMHDEANPLLDKLRLQIAKGRDDTNASVIRFDHPWSRPSLKLKES